ncbi:MAG: homoprotocatechuate degradation operon regulator HpaR [Acidimicrobiaceae bacterium]|nr:homoprotocatechuate degradation operon regulator HpaR [Acidimicrobiaceae bacterium]MBT5581349.1 homoprotocatechuate degradation operon regulator HpaR [Acidimicrobiaceae bacterium]
MGQPIPMRPFTESLPMALLLAREATMQHFRPLLAKSELTEQQWRVLRALASRAEAYEVTELAERTALLAPSVSRIVANLEDRGLIVRTTVAHDQRRARLRLTRSGSALVRRLAPDSEAIYNGMEEQFGADRLAGLMAELKDLAETIGHETTSNWEAS